MIYSFLINSPIVATTEVFILLSSTLIVAVVTLFVLAITFLGEAIGLARNEKALAVKKNINDFKEDIKDLNKEKKTLNEDTNREKLSEVRKKIDLLIQKKDSAEKALENIEKKYGSLKFIDSIVVPNTLFLLTIIFSLISAYWVEDINFKLTFLFAAFISLCYGIYRVAYVLWVIECVASGSDERRWKRTEETYLRALKELEDSKKPKLLVYPQKISERFSLKTNEEKNIVFFVTLFPNYGDYAEDVEIIFYVEPEIEFLAKGGGSPIKQEENFFMPKANSISFRMGNITKSVKTPIDIWLKAKDISGKFTLRYSIHCKGFQLLPKESKSYTIEVSK